MRFWASSESHAPASAGLEATRKKLEPFLDTAFATSDLGALQLKLCYVPIVMPESMHDRYPSRSKAHLKDKIYDCAPILNYEVFVKGSPKDQLKEYVRGIRLAAPHLARFGATPQQVMMFNEILDVAIGQVT